MFTFTTAVTYWSLLSFKEKVFSGPCSHSQQSIFLNPDTRDKFQKSPTVTSVHLLTLQRENITSIFRLLQTWSQIVNFFSQLHIMISKLKILALIMKI
jgi:hypothetical protein